MSADRFYAFFWQVFVKTSNNKNNKINNNNNKNETNLSLHILRVFYKVEKL